LGIVIRSGIERARKDGLGRATGLDDAVGLADIGALIVGATVSFARGLEVQPASKRIRVGATASVNALRTRSIATSYQPVPTPPAGGVATCDGVGEMLCVGLGLAALHTERVMVLVSMVTAPFLASTRPSTVAFVVSVILVSAKMLPTKVEVVPIVAELPTCQ
jgi:hypothetical protein